MLATNLASNVFRLIETSLRERLPLVNVTNLSNQMIIMGYVDENLNRLALQSTNYNLELAIEWIENLN